MTRRFWIIRRRRIGDFTPDSDFSGVLTWLSGAEALYFGYGSWWNTVSDTANIELSRVSFRLADGTVLMDQLQADKDWWNHLAAVWRQSRQMLRQS